LSDPSPDIEVVRDRLINLYLGVSLLMLVGIGVLVFYCVTLPSLTAPGPQQSFGLAISLMALMGAVVSHLLDRAYRLWPLGRRVVPRTPGYVSVQAQANFVRIVILVAAGAAIAYLIAGLLT
jgi:hypothetical protein